MTKLKLGSYYFGLASGVYNAPNVLFQDIELMPAAAIHLDHVKTLELTLKDFQQLAEIRLDGMDMDNLSGKCAGEIIVELS